MLSSIISLKIFALQDEFRPGKKRDLSLRKGRK
jgi:hypothetical protein